MDNLDVRKLGGLSFSSIFFFRETFSSILGFTPVELQEG
jgi:hypothetical protein